MDNFWKTPDQISFINSQALFDIIFDIFFVKDKSFQVREKIIKISLINLHYLMNGECDEVRSESVLKIVFEVKFVIDE